LTRGLAASRLGHGPLARFGTPRRLAVLVRGVEEVSQDLTKEVTGPPVKVAFKDGEPTVAAQKFALSAGIPVQQLRRVSTARGEYLAATVETRGERAAVALPPMLSEVVHGLKWPKSMRWGDVELAWGRPLHWMVALLGGEVLQPLPGPRSAGARPGQ
jgi:glycyl-tRNA synthetase beta chain